MQIITANPVPTNIIGYSEVLVLAPCPAEYMLIKNETSAYDVLSVKNMIK